MPFSIQQITHDAMRALSASTSLRRIQFSDNGLAPANTPPPEPVLPYLGHLCNTVSLLAFGQLAFPRLAGKVDGAPGFVDPPKPLPVLPEGAQALRRLAALEAWLQAGCRIGDTFDLRTGFATFEARISRLPEGGCLDPRDDIPALAVSALNDQLAPVSPAVADALLRGTPSPKEDPTHAPLP